MVVVELGARGFDAFPDPDEELINVALEKLCSLGVERVGPLVFLNIDEGQADVFYYCENEVLTAVVPVLADFFA